jgi:hypothetical protein
MSQPSTSGLKKPLFLIRSLNRPRIFLSSELSTTMAITERTEAELIPGTEILLAADERYGRHSSSNEELLLVPTPSDQPDDPLVRFPKVL